MTKPTLNAKVKTTLFLLRAYNDLDHIAPVIWKMASSGSNTLFLFVADDFSEDYRVKLIEGTGARKVDCSVIAFYYRKIRLKVISKTTRRILDRVLGAVFGRKFLEQNDVACIVTEWGGPDGKGLAPFFLKPSRSMGIPTIAIPHGYHTWLNNDFNTAVSKSINKTGKLPQLKNRNRFSAYVVQSENIRRYCIDSGIDNEKLYVLGSARFCREWFQMNLRLCIQDLEEQQQNSKILVLFFLSHWIYNVDRQATISLLRKIATQNDIRLVIKGHTRGRHIGGLTLEEERELDVFNNVTYAENIAHSPTLVAQSDAIIVYGSSICFEALLQGKPVCKPAFLSRNKTIYDESNMVFEAINEEEVISFIEDCRSGCTRTIDNRDLDLFLNCHIENGGQENSVLQSYVDLIEEKTSAV